MNIRPANILKALKLIFVVSSGVFFLTSFFPANSVEGDRQALMDLYEATGGSSWSNHSGWGRGNPDGSWHGVEVNSQGRVVRLNLRANGLNGQLPESIGNLSRVRYFNVKQNTLSGSIPSSIGQMSSLTHLLLNGRKADMNTVDPLHPGKPPGGSWADERSNNFTGTLPASIGELSNLQWLELNGTGKVGEGLEGAIPESFGNLKNLKGLLLVHNRLDKIPESLGNLTDLMHLGLGFQGRDINGDYLLLKGHGFPQWIGKLAKLKFLWMENNEGIGGKLPDMSGLHDLEIFLADRNKLTGEIPSYFTDGTMPNINMLQFAWNNFRGQMPEIREPNNLAAFTIEGNGITGQIPDSWGTDAASSMINFGLGWNEMEGEIPDLSHMGRLRYMRANDNNFTGKVPMVDTSNEKLNFLHFQNNQMSGEVSAELAKIADLPRIGSGDLRVDNNNFSASDLESLINALKADGNLHILSY
jgi:Leucine-rich repeat (LRR) protein